MTKETIILDPGDDGDYIQRKINDEEGKPSRIIATHGHFDHILAATEHKLAYKIPFLIHAADEFLIKRTQKTTFYFTGIKPDPPPTIDNYLKEGEEIIIGKNKLKVIETPGHTPGSISLIADNKKDIFVGDLIFEGGYIGRTDYQYSNQNKMDKSLKRIKKLAKNKIIHCGHGEDFRLD